MRLPLPAPLPARCPPLWPVRCPPPWPARAEYLPAGLLKPIQQPFPPPGLPRKPLPGPPASHFLLPARLPVSAPHDGQNFAPSFTSPPHFGQNIAFSSSYNLMYSRNPAAAGYQYTPCARNSSSVRRSHLPACGIIHCSSSFRQDGDILRVIPHVAVLHLLYRLRLCFLNRSSRHFSNSFSRCFPNSFSLLRRRGRRAAPAAATTAAPALPPGGVLPSSRRSRGPT